MSAKDDEKPSCSKAATARTDEKPGCSTSKAYMDRPSGSNYVFKDPFSLNGLNLPAEKMKSLYLAHPDLIKIPSLIPPRDLNLLGANNKKKFTPNLNVKRNKNLGVKTSKDTTRGVQRGKVDKNERGRGGRGAGRGARGGRGGRGGANLIQTTGVFSEGVGVPVVKKLSSSGYSSRYPSDETSSTMIRPIISKSSKQSESLPIVDIPSVFDDKDDEEDFFDDMISSNDLPVIIKKRKPQNLNDKLDTSNQDSTEAVTDIQSSCLEPIKIPKQFHSIFESPDPMTFVMQLPDSLPFETCDLIYHDPTKEKEEDVTQSKLCTTKPLPKAISLTRFNDGEIGKLVRYKSGKVKFVIGPNCFDLIMGINTNLTQQLMSMSVKEDEQKANVIQLGSIDAKVTAVPDWKHMLHELDLKMNPSTD